MTKVNFSIEAVNKLILITQLSLQSKVINLINLPVWKAFKGLCICYNCYIRLLALNIFEQIYVVDMITCCTNICSKNDFKSYKWFTMLEYYQHQNRVTYCNMTIIYFQIKIFLYSFFVWLFVVEVVRHSTFLHTLHSENEDICQKLLLPFFYR